MHSPPADLLAVACPGCHAALAVAPLMLGGRAACPVCGAGFMVPVPVARSPLPQAPVESPAPIVPQMPDAAATEPEFRPIDTAEPAPTTIGRGSDAIELRRLTPEEKAARKVRRNLVTIGLGTLFLFAIVLAATRAGRKPRRRR